MFRESVDAGNVVGIPGQPQYIGDPKWCSKVSSTHHWCGCCACSSLRSRLQNQAGIFRSKVTILLTVGSV